MAVHTGTQFVRLAARYIGTPYVWGGSSPSGFDCSGLVYFVLGKLGINAPRTSQAQYAWTQRVPASSLKPGDLVFLNFPGESGAGHVMIWLGGNRVLQAPSSGQRVQVSHFDPKAPGSNEWGATVVGYGRIRQLSYKGEPPSVPVPGSPAGSGGGGGVVGVLNDVANPVGAAVGAVGGAASAASGTAHFFGELASASFWLRAVEVVGGFLILMLGLYLLTRQVGLSGVPEPPTPGLSDETLAELQRSPGAASRPATRRRRVVRHELPSEASERRAAISERASRAGPSDEIPF